eukprot:3455155-Pyramimonas_sp.AAC.1
MLPCVPAGMQAHLEARQKLSRTSCPGRRVAARPVEQRKGAPGGHHHSPASNLKPFSSQRALRELGSVQNPESEGPWGREIFPRELPGAL